MPVFDTDSTTSGGDFGPTPSDGWTMPLGRIGGIRLYVSYSVFVAMAVLLGLVAMAQGRAGNGDLPLLTIICVGIWMTGWLLQLAVYYVMHSLSIARSQTLVVGLLGVEAGAPLQLRTPWTASATLVVTLCTLAALFAVGAGGFFFHMATQTNDWFNTSTWRDELTRTGFGFNGIEHLALTASWLFWVQASCQLYPLPKHLGRAAGAASVAAFASDADIRLQLRLLRRFMQIVAIATLVAALATIVAGSPPLMTRIILVVIAVYLWVSTNHDDLGDWLAAIAVAKNEPLTVASDSESNASTRIDWMESLRMRKKRKLARAALHRERSEASDLSRLDQVLEQVSQQGIESLKREDRELLKRVSSQLQQERAREQDDLPDLDL